MCHAHFTVIVKTKVNYETLYITTQGKVLSYIYLKLNIVLNCTIEFPHKNITFKRFKE